MDTAHYALIAGGLLAMAVIAWTLIRDYRKRRDADRAFAMVNARSQYRNYRRLGWDALRAMRQMRQNGFEADTVIEAAIQEDDK
jgi:hypothetical protein